MTNSAAQIAPIGSVHATQQRFSISVDPEFRRGLEGLDGFSHIIVTWVCAPDPDGAALTIERPYTNGPDSIGVFATRSPVRPNPLALSICTIISVDLEEGEIDLGWIDAFDGTAVLDIKPYYPASDRVRDVSVPGWCSDWPQWFEDSATFDWESVFN